MQRRSFVGSVTAGAAALVMPGGAVQGAGPLPGGGRRVERLDAGWTFHRGDAPGAERTAFDAAGWESVTLPHAARSEALVTGVGGAEGGGAIAQPGEPQWQGSCWYRRTLRLPAGEAGRLVLLRFEGAMNVADVFLDGERVGGHLGGYLPFTLELSGELRPDTDHLLAVRLDNRDNAITGPKPLRDLDFNTYHGLYRPVILTVADPLHITDPILAGWPAGGGVFVTYPSVTADAATLRVLTHVGNGRDARQAFRVRATLRDARGATLATALSAEVSIPSGEGHTIEQDLAVVAPRLWSPAAPHLHTLTCEVVTEQGVVDAVTERIGIRRIAIAPGRCEINGERLFLRGTNRHQEYPYIGYALSDAAQYRDARKIKDAGFDYVRLSHYPQAPAFLDACDELGLVVMNCIPGWQYFNPDPRFVELQYQNCRDLIRRDRNHPCVMLWEVSLNESGMTPEFVARTHAIAHEEYPGDQCFTAGWMHGYDVFIRARQHGGCREGEQDPCLVSEYGDWEYYAMNAGLDQAAWGDLSPAESNSRQQRWQGERALLQQAANFQEAHDDNRSGPAFADGLWAMFDYNRGYAPEIESSGCMDIFRLPKFSYHFFRSQRDAPPMAFIASHWTAASSPDVRVFSNCEEVALLLNGRLVARQRPDRDRISARLAHPPFTFQTGGFEAGLLEAVGYRGGRVAARHAVRTPGPVARLSLALDTSGRAAHQGRPDQLFCHASLTDARGTVVPDAWENVAFGVTGAARLVGMNPIATDAGIATILLETQPGSAPAAVYAVALVPGSAAVLSASVAVAGRAPAHQANRTPSGADVVVRGGVVASLDAGAPRYRVPPSAPPERREPFPR